MKKRIITLAIFLVAIISSFILGTTQAKTEIETVTKVKTVDKIIEVVPNGYINTTTDDFFNNYIDMRTVTDFEANENGLQLYTNDGNGYYWEK